MLTTAVHVIGKSVLELNHSQAACVVMHFDHMNGTLKQLVVVYQVANVNASTTCQEMVQDLCVVLVSICRKIIEAKMVLWERVVKRVASAPVSKFPLVVFVVISIMIIVLLL